MSECVCECVSVRAHSCLRVCARVCASQVCVRGGCRAPPPLRVVSTPARGRPTHPPPAHLASRRLLLGLGFSVQGRQRVSTNASGGFGWRTYAPPPRALPPAPPAPADPQQPGPGSGNAWRAREGTWNGCRQWDVRLEGVLHAVDGRAGGPGEPGSAR